MTDCTHLREPHDLFVAVAAAFQHVGVLFETGGCSDDDSDCDNFHDSSF